MKSIAVRSVAFSLAFSIFAVIGYSQERNGVEGRIVDSNGDVVAGATLTVRHQDVRLVAKAVTDGEGRYSLTNMSEGKYDVTIGAIGFATLRSEMTIPSTQPVVFTITPGGIAVDVSVTSSYLAGTPESLSEIPGSIERIDRQTLENSRAFNFSEVLRKVSGVNVRDEEGFGLRPNIGIRGTNPTRSTKVLLLEDGLPLSYAPYGDNASYYHPPVERYESIEVLKGSGQIAYGPQTIAGLVNYLTPNPPDKPTFSFKLEGGNRRFFNGGAGFGGTFGKLGTIFNFNHKQGNGSKENTSFKLYDFSNKSVLQLNARNALTGKFTFFREDSNLTYTGATEAEFAADPAATYLRTISFMAAGPVSRCSTRQF